MIRMSRNKRLKIFMTGFSFVEANTLCRHDSSVAHMERNGKWVALSKQNPDSHCDLMIMTAGAGSSMKPFAYADAIACAYLHSLPLTTKAGRRLGGAT